MHEHWLKTLGLDGGLIAFVGAGGKKTALCRVARDFPGRVAATATAFTTPLRRIGDGAQVVTVDPEGGGDWPQAVIGAANPRLCVLGPEAKKGRCAGLAPDRVTELHRVGGFDATLVKADGARMRGVKAPQPGEPVLPPQTDRVVALLSIGVLGRPLDAEHVHRPERVAAVTGLGLGDPLSADALATLIRHPAGLLGNIPPDLPATVIINQVDDAERLGAAREVARAALAGDGHRLPGIALAAMAAAGPPLREWVAHETV